MILDLLTNATSVTYRITRTSAADVCHHLCLAPHSWCLATACRIGYGTECQPLGLLNDDNV
jgi:hypothetical protein